MPGVQLFLKVLNRLRALFPSWKFFGETGDHLFIEARLRRKNNEWDVWRQVEPLRRGVWQEFFHNPYGLLDWILFSLLQEIGSQVCMEYDQKKELLQELVSDSVPLELIQNILEIAWVPLCNKGVLGESDIEESPPDFFQFRIRWAFSFLGNFGKEDSNSISEKSQPVPAADCFESSKIVDLFVSNPCRIRGPSE